jgi:hypothetical protein
VALEDAWEVDNLTRLTSVLRHEDGSWRLVRVRVSIGVPDEEVAELQQRWSSTS